MKIELPTALEDWQVKPVGEVFDINPETLPSSTAADFQFRYIPLESVCPEQIEFASVHQIRFGEAPSRARRVIRPGDILISTVRPNLQGFAEFQPPDDSSYVCSTGFAVLRPKNGHDQQFYLQQLLSDFGASQFCALVTGTNYPAISDRDFARLRLLVPKDGLERETASVLRKISAAIVAARESIAKAERLQKALMQQLLTGRLKPDGTPRTIKEFCAHPKAGYVPIRWEVSPLKRLAQVQRGKFSHRPRGEPRFYGGPYPFIQTGDVSNSRGYILSHTQTLSDEGVRISRRFPKGTIFISIVGVNVAATAIASYDVYATDSVIGMIPNDGVVSEYLEFYLRSVQQKLAVLAGDSARENLNYGILKPLLVKYPIDPKEQQRIADVLCNCESLIRAKEQKIAALQRLKKSLMQNLLTGRIRLPVAAASSERPSA